MKLRTCRFKVGIYNENNKRTGYEEKDGYFHMFFQEGGFEHYCDGSEGSIDVGAVVEDSSGAVHKVFNINDIVFLDTP